jgi:hypothetical protein
MLLGGDDGTWIDVLRRLIERPPNNLKAAMVDFLRSLLAEATAAGDSMPAGKMMAKALKLHVDAVIPQDLRMAISTNLWRETGVSRGEYDRIADAINLKELFERLLGPGADVGNLLYSGTWVAETEKGNLRSVFGKDGPYVDTAPHMAAVDVSRLLLALLEGKKLEGVPVLNLQLDGAPLTGNIDGNSMMTAAGQVLGSDLRFPVATGHTTDGESKSDMETWVRQTLADQVRDGTIQAGDTNVLVVLSGDHAELAVLQNRSGCFGRPFCLVVSWKESKQTYAEVSKKTWPSSKTTDLSRPAPSAEAVRLRED